MRTTGIRCAPVPAPRPNQPPVPPKQPPIPPKQPPIPPKQPPIPPKQPSVPPQPLPRTRFLQKASSEEPQDPLPDAPSNCPSELPQQGTFIVISESLASPAKSKAPPPKPPRTPSVRDSPSDALPVIRRPGLMEVLSRPSSSPSTSPAHPHPAPAATPARPAPQGRGGGLGAVPTRRAPRPRLSPLSLPVPPSSTPPRPTRGTPPPPIPLRPSPTQIAVSRARMGTPEPRPAGARTVTVPQSPVCSVEDFEDGCKEVFRNTRAAKDLASRGKHVQAASHYQVALTALDRVLRTQVLTLTQHEMTRQRLFLLQQDVFSLRKEALNGFTDSQTAVRAPRGLSPTRPTPGAPPSYDDVLNEDRLRLQDEPLSLSGQSSSQGQAVVEAASLARQPPHQKNQHARPRPHQASPTQSPSTQQPTTRLRPHSTIASGTVDMLEPPTAPSTRTSGTGPSTRHVRAPQKPSRSSSSRPKSSYHPASQPDQPMSLPPPLLPVSLFDSHSSPPLQSPAASSLLPLLDEVLESQMKALHMCESAKEASKPASQPEELPSSKVVSANLQEGEKIRKIVHENDGKVSLLGDVMAASGLGGEGKEEKDEGNTALSLTSSKEDPFLSLDPLSSAKSKAEEGGGEGEEGGGGGRGGGGGEGGRGGGGGGGGGGRGEKDQEKNIIPTSLSSIDDPFLSLDPFPPVESMAQDSGNIVFPEGNLPSAIPSSDTDTQCSHSPAFSDNFTPDSPSFTEHRKTSLSPTGTQSSPNNLGDSILEALDFAIAPTPGHRRVSPQSSRGRSYSEENLLDTSHNTLEAILNPKRDMCASRASIIEEFDPLVASHTEPDAKSEKKVFNEKKTTDHQEEVEAERSAVLRPALRNTVHKGLLAAKEEEEEEDEEEEEEEDMEEEEGTNYSPPPDYYSEMGAVRLAEAAAVDDYHYNLPKKHPDAQHSFDKPRGRTSYSSSGDSSSILSWPPDLTPRTPSTPVSPLYPCLTTREEEEEEEEEEGDKGVGVGRSAFYRLPSDRGNGSRRRDLLRIHEGVKIYFIHTDGVITSPWKKPFLAVYRDPAKAQMLGDGLVVSVGNTLWACELSKKATLVLRTLAGGYVFSEVAGKPECKAVCVRVPSSVRKAQQEFLNKILEQNTLMEEERPKGFTKAISKGASSAATRMNKLVENSSTSHSQPFVRRNSVRALKGVTKRLNTLAEKTGATLKELPREYEALQEAADTLAFARNAKMIQYI